VQRCWWDRQHSADRPNSIPSINRVSSITQADVRKMPRSESALAGRWDFAVAVAGMLCSTGLVLMELSGPVGRGGTSWRRGQSRRQEDRSL
jgi:hypothetical protein